MEDHIICLSVFRDNLLAFNQVESICNSWLRVVIILSISFPCITTLVSSAYRTVKSNSDTLHINYSYK